MKKTTVLSMVLLTIILLTLSPGLAAEFPIAKTAGVEMSKNAAFDGTNYLVAVEGNSSAKDSINAQLISGSDGSLVGSLIPIGQGASNANAAFDGTNYLMIWQTCSAWTSQCTNNLYGQFINTSGTPVGTSDFYIAHVGDNTDVWGFAFGGGKNFVVYGGDNNSLYGRMISTSGTVGSEISISTSGATTTGINSLAFDGTNFLVVWDTGLAIKGRFISSAGETASGAEFVIATKPNGPENPVNVAFDGTNYLVVWHEGNEVLDEFDGSLNLFGQLVTTSGALTGGRIDVTGAVGDQIFPAIAFDGTNYLVTWIDMRNDANYNGVCNTGEKTCWDTYGQYISTSGSLVGAEIPIDTDSGNQFGAVAGFNGGKYLLLKNNMDNFEGEVGDIYGTFLIPSSPTTSPGLTVTITSAESENGTGTGKVISTGFNCSNTSGTTLTDCDQTYTKAAKVTLKAVPDSGSSLKSWSGCDTESLTAKTCIVNISGSDREVTATFEALPRYTVTVTPEGNGEGTVKSAQRDVSNVTPGINCDSTSESPDCEGMYLKGSTVVLTAVAKAGTGSKFIRWSGANSCADKTKAACKLSSLSADTEVTAVFGHPAMDVSEEVTEDVLDLAADTEITFTITNTGYGKLTGSLTISGTNKKNFKLYNADTDALIKRVNLSEGGSQGIKIKFVTTQNTAAGEYPADLRITSNDPDNKTRTITLHAVKQ